MASRFFGYDPWDYTPYHYQPTTTFRNPNTKPQHKPKPKPVSIPVHFVDSSTENDSLPPPQLPSKKPAMPPPAPAEHKKRSPPPRPQPKNPALSLTAAAVKVQAAVRGFLVRKMLRTVRAVEKEAEEIAEQVAAEKAAISTDAKERLRVGEMLMRLLFRLDSVHGVREYRRKVNKKVMALQDAVDGMAAEAAEAKAVDDSIPEAPEMTNLAQARESAEESNLGGGSTLESPESVAGRVEEKTEAMEEEEPAPEQEAPVKDAKLNSTKLMEMVAALCERNAQQCALIGELAERVDVLERTVRKMERKRKQKIAKGKHAGNDKKCMRGCFSDSM